MKFELDSLEKWKSYRILPAGSRNHLPKNGFLILLVSGSPAPYLTCQGIDFNVADGLVIQIFQKNHWSRKCLIWN